MEQSKAVERWAGKPGYGRAFAELVMAARYHGLVTYQAIAAAIGVPASGRNMQMQVGSVLEAISRIEHQNGSPLLSALCVNVEGKVGDGFYKLARGLERLREGADEEGFWEAERRRVYATWGWPRTKGRVG